MKKPTEKRRGWVEVSYRLSKTIPRSYRDIAQADYTNVGGRLPLEEFENIFDVYEAFDMERADAPRGIQPFDVITVFVKTPQSGHTSLVVLPPERIPEFAWEDSEQGFKCEVMKRKCTNNVLIPLPRDHRFCTGL